MRVYPHVGSCGNTVARLISNLQTRFDGALAPPILTCKTQQTSSLVPHWRDNQVARHLPIFDLGEYLTASRPGGWRGGR